MKPDSATRSPVRHVVIDAEGAGRRLDNFLGSMFKDVPKPLIYRLIRSGEVRVNGGRRKPVHKLLPGDVVRVPPIQRGGVAEHTIPRALLAEFEAQILFEDPAVIVLNKPSGLAVHAGSGLRFGMIDIARAARPHCARLDLVHRLDRETSGCLLLAKDTPTLRLLNAQLAERRLRKTYLTLVAGRPLRRMTVDAPLDVEHRQSAERHIVPASEGRSAVTHFRLVRHFADCALLEAEPETGRTHQIRVHAAYRGHPVGGDLKYGRVLFNRQLLAVGLRRLFLHALRLEFELARKHRIEAPLPVELNAVLDQLQNLDAKADRENFDER